MATTKQATFSTILLRFFLLMSFQLSLCKSARREILQTSPSLAALLDLKAEILKYNPNALSKWSENGDPCDKTWQGNLQCNAAKEVTRLNFGIPPLRLQGPIPGKQLAAISSLRLLDLAFNSFSGSIPEEIGELSNLQNLVLKFNNLSGTIPAAIGNLKQLKVLELSDNNLTGTLPQNLGYLTVLARLDLRNNRLEGSLPNELRVLNLYKLLLSNNSFNGSIPAWIGRMNNLRVIQFDSNKFSGNIPEELGDLSLLLELYLQENALAGSIPDSFGDLKELRELFLNSNQLSGNIPSSLARLVHLSFVNLSSNEGINGSIPSSLPQLQSLVVLSLSYNSLSGTLPLSLGNMTNLERFEVDNNQLEGPIPSSFGKLTKMRILSLNDNRLNGSLPLELCDMNRLRRINIRGNLLIGRIPPCITSLPYLEYLNVADNRLNGTVPAVNQDSNLQLSYDNNCLTGVSGQLPSCSPQAPPSQPQATPAPNGTSSPPPTPSSNPPLPPPPPPAVADDRDAPSNPVGPAVLTGIFVGISGLLCVVLAATAVARGWVMPPNPENLKFKKYGIKEFSLSRIRRATKNFSTVIGRGGFGTTYLAERLIPDTADGRAIVKRAKDPSRRGEFMFRCRVELLCRSRHPYLVSLLGVHCGPHEHILVLEHCAHGNLYDRLHDPDLMVLVWESRVKVAVSLAYALQFLHHATSPPAIHRHVTSSNVFLTPTDFAKLSELGHYLRPEGSVEGRGFSRPSGGRRSRKARGGPNGGGPGGAHHHEAANEKSDVYGFGVLLLELISGQPVMKDVHITSLAAPFLEDPQMMILMVDSRLGGHVNQHELTLLGGIARECIREAPETRPSMQEIVHRLEQELRFDPFYFENMSRNEEDEDVIDEASGGRYNSTNNGSMKPLGSWSSVLSNAFKRNQPSHATEFLDTDATEPPVQNLNRPSVEMLSLLNRQRAHSDVTKG